MRETTPKNENVNPSLDLGKHQAAHRRIPSFFFLLLEIFLSLFPLCKFLKGGLVSVSLSKLFSWTNVWKCFREVPLLEDLFVDVVSVVGTHGCFGPPPLLEESFARPLKGDFLGFRADGAVPEVV